MVQYPPHLHCYLVSSPSGSVGLPHREKASTTVGHRHLAIDVSDLPCHDAPAASLVVLWAS